MALHVLGSVDPASLLDARLQLHHATQFIAAFGQSLLDPRDDDSHRTMQWDSDDSRFVSEPGPDDLQAFVDLNPLAIGIRRGDEDLGSLRLMGATMRTARAWMQKTLGDALNDESFELEWPEYDMPSHFVLEGRPFQAKATSLEELSRWYSGADAVLKRLASEESDADPVRTWPHHFDIATLVVLGRDTDGAPTKTVGVGLSPGDEGIAEPYWYINAWGYPDDAAFGEMQAPGHTHREGWNGFVLTATELIDAGREGRADPTGEGERQAHALDGFLERGIAAAKGLFEV